MIFDIFSVIKARGGGSKLFFSKWAHRLHNFARLIFCDCSKSGPTRKKRRENNVNIGICMENGQKMIKKADKISELTPIFLKFHTKQVQFKGILK